MEHHFQACIASVFVFAPKKMEASFSLTWQQSKYHNHIYRENFILGVGENNLITTILHDISKNRKESKKLT